MDARLPGQLQAGPTVATGNVSVPRRSGRLSTVVYQHGTAVSFYDAPSNPNVFGELRGETARASTGRRASAVFAGGGFIYVAPDYPGLGDSTVPRHRYFHAADRGLGPPPTCSAASRQVLASLHVQRSDELFTFGFSQGGHAALALHRELRARTRRGDGHGDGRAASSTSSASSCRRSRTRRR